MRSVKSVTEPVNDAAVYSLGLTVVTRAHTCHRLWKSSVSMNGIYFLYLFILFFFVTLLFALSHFREVHNAIPVIDGESKINDLNPLGPKKTSVSLSSCFDIEALENAPDRIPSVIERKRMLQGFLTIHLFADYSCRWKIGKCKKFPVV